MDMNKTKVSLSGLGRFWPALLLFALALCGGLTAKALTMEELMQAQNANQPEVLGLTTVTLNSTTATFRYVRAVPVSFSSGQWTYNIEWSRVKNAIGSAYVSPSINSANRLLSVNSAVRIGSQSVNLNPSTRYRVEFYSKANRTGTLLLRKYFTTMAAPAADTVTTCTYDTPPSGCLYLPGSNYNATTQCGRVLTCTQTSTSTSATPAPTVTFTVNGQSNISAQYGQAIMFNWSSTNADSLTIQTTAPVLTFPDNPDYANNVPLYKKMHIIDIEPLVDYATIPLSGSKAYYLRFGFYYNRLQTITLTATQSATGKTAVATVVINATQPPDPVMSVNVFQYPALNQSSPGPESFTIKPGGSVIVDIWRAGGMPSMNLPVVDRTVMPAGFTVVDNGQGKDSNGGPSPYSERFTITAPSSAADGVYFIRFKGSGNGIYDVGVKVSR